MYDFDVLVIGSGPGGQKAAIAAAKLGRRVAIIERTDMFGGSCSCRWRTGPCWACMSSAPAPPSWSTSAGR
ncbi:MAG TPA: FAD-dependent oxidoreductase [Streptosporangiaceae bacterium]|nr:FAD-dependent oxidoreductase [Streptosporangiaceae bacterium]